MKKVLIILSVLMLAAGTTDLQAQWIKKLGKKAAESAKRATERNVEKKVEQTVDKAFDGAEDAVKGEGKKENKEAASTGNTNANEENNSAVPGDGQQDGGQSLEMAYAKSDFVPGDEIIFEDLLVGEKLGEFPSMWDLKSGNAEVANVGGESAIHLEQTTTILPFMKEKDYLPDEFTVEFDLFVPGYKGLGLNSRYDINFRDTNGKVAFKIYFYLTTSDIGMRWNWLNGGENNSGSIDRYFPFNRDQFNHLAFSFNKRAMKAYVNGERFVNIPRCDAPTRFEVYSYDGAATDNRFIKNIRIAKGAVPLYDRMMSDGKFITYGITFDVGKSVIKPESMGEINRIVKLMNDNPDLKFSVEGHTDSTGKEAGNQTLSEARSKAIVDKLVELGIAADRLTPSGKGQTSPIADNATDEGRAKNRRVEFVKI
ncbi:OmpA family protein [Parabacteroides sp.]